MKLDGWSCLVSCDHVGDVGNCLNALVKAVFSDFVAIPLSIMI